jgi:hypothetical protein
MLGATVPKTAVDEYSHPGTSEDKISGETLIGKRPACHPVAEPQSVHGSTHSDLWSGISLPIASHNAADALR